MNTYSVNFVDLLQDMLARHGREILRTGHFSQTGGLRPVSFSKLANMLHDWTQNKFADESALFLLAVKSGAAEKVFRVKKMSRETAWKIAAQFAHDYCIREDKALETIGLLVILIHTDYDPKKAPFQFDINERMYTLWRRKKPAGESAQENKVIDIKGGTIPPYLIMQTPVTQQEYWSVTGANPSYTTGGDHGQAQLPVDGVHWYAAVDFCNQKSIGEKLSPCYAIDKTNPDADNLSPMDFLRWKVEWLPGTKGWRLPTAAEWEYAYKTCASFTVNAGLEEWCWDFSGTLFKASQFYNNTRVVFTINQRSGRPEELHDASAQGDGCCFNVNKNRTNYGGVCFSYAGNYGFRLARSGT
jgi:hypothetical protein